MARCSRCKQAKPILHKRKRNGVAVVLCDNCLKYLRGHEMYKVLNL